MLISYNWLQELLPDLKKSPSEIADLLTAHSFETNLVREIKIDPQIIVSRITNLEPHPHADRLRLASIDTGAAPFTVVCGAKNIQVGDVVPYGPPGTTVFDGEGESFAIKVAKIRGVASPGMLLSPRELGLGAAHEGIYVLPSDTPVGSRLSAHLPADLILEADITPDRAHDCLSHLGIARELAAVLRITVKEPETISLPENLLPAPWRLEIEGTGHTLRYRGILFDQIQVLPSPLKIQSRLWAMGTRPINHVVDLTNCLMFETGIPTHAFDANKLPGLAIGVRRANQVEVLAALDGKTYQLTGDDTVITSGNQPIALAGIMGGAATQVDENTTRVFLEIANFRGYGIQQTSARLKINSESSARHKKDISPALLDFVAVRANQLFSASGALLTGSKEFYPRPAARLAIPFHPTSVSRISGISIPDDEVTGILSGLRCAIETKTDPWLVTPPPDRLDLTGPHDLVEEVLRLAGYHRIPAQKPPVTPKAALQGKPAWRELIRDILVAAGGFEVLNYSFDDEIIRRRLGLNKDGRPRITVDNPPSPEQKYLRDRLYPRLIASALANQGELKRSSTNAERLLFEIGTVFQKGEDGAVSGIIESDHLAVLLLGAVAQPVRRAELLNQLLAPFGLVKDSGTGGREIIAFPPGHPVRNKLGMDIAVVELDVDHLARESRKDPVWQLPPEDSSAVIFQSLPKYPAVYRDLSILVGPEISAAQIRQMIHQAGRPLLMDVNLFDVYSPGKLTGGEGDKQGLAFHLMYQSPERTLTDAEVTALHEKITRQLQAQCQAQIR